jgi:hypothetical protein
MTRIIIVAVMASVIGSGCATMRQESPRFSTRYSGPLAITTCNQAGMDLVEKQHYQGKDCGGGLTDGYGQIWVLEDWVRTDRPDFERLGHEVWHQLTLGGNFHDNDTPALVTR